MDWNKVVLILGDEGIIEEDILKKIRTALVAYDHQLRAELDERYAQKEHGHLQSHISKAPEPASGPCQHHRATQDGANTTCPHLHTRSDTSGIWCMDCGQHIPVYFDGAYHYQALYPTGSCFTPEKPKCEHCPHIFYEGSRWCLVCGQKLKEV